MEDEIEVGEYVRTPLQGIYIISHINLNFDDSDYKKVCLCQNAKVGFTSINETKKWKHSKNITDLIEVRRLCKWEICIFYWNSNRKFTYNKSYRWNIYP